MSLLVIACFLGGRIDLFFFPKQILLLLSTIKIVLEYQHGISNGFDV